MTNSIYLKPFDRVRSNHPFWVWPFRTIMIHSSKANTGASSALSLAAKAQERRLISQPDMESQYPIIAAGAINVMLSTER